MSQVKFIIFLLLALIVGLSFVLILEQQPSNTTRVRADVPSPSPTPLIPTLLEPQSMISPDGEVTLTMEGQQLGDKVTYSFFTSADGETAGQPVFTTEVDSSERFSIPFNTWSPENTHFFVKKSGMVRDDYYVFFKSGESLSEDTQYLDIQELFAEQIEGMEIEDATGWAAPKLLLVNTKEINGKTKASFWFDVTTQSFIRLGTYFR